MNKPGRQSAGDAERNALADSVAGRMEPPDDLTEEELVEWNKIVNSLPANYFRAPDAPLLRAFCASAALYNEALKRIRDEGIVITIGAGTNRQRQQAHPAKDILTSQASAMAVMASKLRLCPSARMVQAKASTLTQGGKSQSAIEGSGKPWDKSPLPSTYMQDDDSDDPDIPDRFLSVQ